MRARSSAAVTIAVPRLADHHRRRRIGGARCRLEIRPHGEQRRKHGDDRIAGARDVAHLDREGRHMDRLAALGVEQHAVLAHGHQHGLASHGAGERRRRRGNLAMGRDRMTGGVAELLAVRGDHGRPAVDREIASLGIDHDRLPELAGLPDHGADDAFGEHALGVVGEHHRAGLRQRRGRALDQGGFDLAGDRLRRFPVGAQQVGREMLGHETQLAGGRPRGIDHEVRFDRALEFAERLLERSGLPDHRR